MSGNFRRGESPSLPPRCAWSFWACALITIASALTGAGFSMAALATADGHTNAMYAASRSLSLALVAILVVFLRSPRGLMTVALAMTLVQFGDAIVGFTNHDALKTFGPASLALVNAVALILFRRSWETPVAPCE
jgi:hypothetical protein